MTIYSSMRFAGLVAIFFVPCAYGFINPLLRNLGFQTTPVFVRKNTITTARITDRMKVGHQWQASAALEIAEKHIDISSGINMAYYSLPAAKPTGRPPVIFIHGLHPIPYCACVSAWSFHGGWCWAENWMPYFSQRGFDTYAVSLRGTSSSPLPAEAVVAGKKTVLLSEHVQDLSAFMDSVLPESSLPPVLIGHSFGGMYVQKFLEANAKPVHAAALLCSVPPSGNGAIVGRFIRRSPLLALDIVRGFVFKQAGTNLRIARKLFFSESSPSDETIQTYMQRFAADGVVTLDVRKAINEFPSKTCNKDGVADFLTRAPSIYVMGATGDKVVDLEGVAETAAFYGTKEVMVDCAHDLMLEDKWMRPAEMLAEWLEGTLK